VTRLIRAVTVWRTNDKAALADKRDRDLQRAEYRARNELRSSADQVDGKAGES
jgi:hypothetical protein